MNIYLISKALKDIEMLRPSDREYLWRKLGVLSTIPSPDSWLHSRTAPLRLESYRCFLTRFGRLRLLWLYDPRTDKHDRDLIILGVYTKSDSGEQGTRRLATNAVHRLQDLFDEEGLINMHTERENNR